MTIRSIGVEEEMYLVDPRTARPVPRSEDVQEVDDDRDEGAPQDVTQELFLEQVETTTDPAQDLATLRAHVVEARLRAAADAQAVGAALLPSPTPVVGRPQHVTPHERYRWMADRHRDLFPAVAVCGMHVHVDVEDDEEAVRVIDRLGPWLPVVTALSAGSPFSEGADTGFASWRARQWDRWPTAGPTEPFGDLATYRREVEAAVASGVAIDDGMVYLDARVGRATPTVEVRVMDVQLDVDDGVAFAGLVRSLVTTVAEVPDLPGWSVARLRTARWLAQRDGVTGRLIHPVDGTPVPAAEAVEALLDAVDDALGAAGDRTLVRSHVDALLADGGAAGRARRVAAGDPQRWADHVVERTRQSLATARVETSESGTSSA